MQSLPDAVHYRNGFYVQVGDWFDLLCLSVSRSTVLPLPIARLYDDK
jgi:hypothetical protein